jgi:hypothetical protein
VKRKARSRHGGIPEQLARFVAAEWPDAACIHEALSAWSDACLAWVREHPDSLPFGQYGDIIDVLFASEVYSREMPPCPARRRPGYHNGVPTGPETAEECPFKPCVA